jgi:hypothetical protein
VKFLADLMNGRGERVRRKGHNGQVISWLNWHTFSRPSRDYEYRLSRGHRERTFSCLFVNKESAERGAKCNLLTLGLLGDIKSRIKKVATYRTIKRERHDGEQASSRHFKSNKKADFIEARVLCCEWSHLNEMNERLWGREATDNKSRASQRKKLRRQTMSFFDSSWIINLIKSGEERKVKGNSTGHLRRAAERSLNELLIDCRGEGGPKRLVTQHANLFFCTSFGSAPHDIRGKSREDFFPSLLMKKLYLMQ